MLGLILSACHSGDPVLAHVGDETVKASELKARYKDLPAGTPRNVRKEDLLNGLVVEKLYAAMAQKEGLAMGVYVQRLMSTEFAVSNNEIAAYLKSHPKDFSDKPDRSRYVRSVLMSSKFNAWLAKAKTSIPVTFDVAAVKSLDLSK